jgi:hypothetical protein
VSRILRAAVGAVGIAAVGLAGTLAFAPGAGEQVVDIDVLVRTTPLSEAALRALAVAVAGAICAAWVVWTAGPTGEDDLPEGPLSEPTTDFSTLREAPPEHATADPMVGEEFDERVVRSAAAAASADDYDAVRCEIRRIAVSAVAHVEGCDEAAAEDTVREEEWTDDAIAAAYVSDRESALLFRQRLRAWLRPSRTRIDRIERSLSAIENRLDEGWN